MVDSSEDSMTPFVMMPPRRRIKSTKSEAMPNDAYAAGMSRRNSGKERASRIGSTIFKASCCHCKHAKCQSTEMQRSMPLLTRKLQATCACACLESFVENDAEQLNG